MQKKKLIKTIEGAAIGTFTGYCGFILGSSFNEADLVKMSEDLGRPRKRFIPSKEAVFTTCMCISSPITREEHTYNTRIRYIRNKNKNRQR